MGESYKHGKKCCYLTFIKMLAIVFCCLLLLFYLALRLIIRALSWSNFMMLKDFFS